MAKANIDTKDAIKEINALINSFNSLIKATGDVSSVSQGNFRKVETALSALRTVTLQATASFDKMNDAQKQAVIINQQEASAIRTTAYSLDEKTKKTKEATKATSELQNAIGSLLSAFGLVSGIQIFANLLKDAYSLMKTFDSVSFALHIIEKDALKAAESQRFLLEITTDYGVELVSTTERWLKFLAAAKQSGVTLRDTEQIFRSVTKASAVLGLQTDELQTVYLALEQMMSKGKITTEELRRQLGERLPGAVGIMAAAVGVSVQELDKMLKKGELLSAEVLPKFARALESAYGIETIDKIETLTAAQNTLTNAWELFVKGVSEGKGVVAGGLDLITMSLKGLLHLLTPDEILEQQKFDQTIIENKKKITKQFIEDTKARLDATLKAGEKYDDIDKEAKQALVNYQTAIANGNKKDLDALQKHLQEKIKLRQEYDTRIDAMMQSTAASSLQSAQATYDKETTLVKKLQAHLKYNEDHFRMTQPVSDERLKELIKDARGRQAAAEALLTVMRMYAEAPSPFVPGGDDEKKKTIPKKYLDDIKDLTNEEKILRLKAQEDINKSLLDGEEINFEERSKLMLENSSKRIEIADTEYKEALEKAKDYYDKEIEELERAKREGKKIVGDEVQYRKDLQKNYRDQQLMANTNHNKALLANEKAFDSDLKKLNKLIEDDKIRMVNDVANQQIITAKKVYEASKKTAKDKAQLDKALNEIAIEQANAVIDVQIQTLQNMLEMDGISKTVADSIKSQILKLEAAKKNLFLDDKDAKEQQKILKEVLEYISDAANAITDLSDAIFDRKIEHINAEIRAESDKYDRLIELAKNNKDEQQRLQEEKDAKIAELEAKKLKEERKKAMFQKANALIQIAINTAIAASLVAAQTGVGAFVTVPMIIALGAIQAAAVLAQPLPQYEEGLKDAKTDHKGIINDGKNQEFIERGNSILTTKTKNAIINLKKGDTIYKSYDDMAESSDVFKNLSRSILLSNLTKVNNDQAITMELMLAGQLKNMQKDIKKGIHDGFNKVTINNITKIDMDWLRYKNDTL